MNNLQIVTDNISRCSSIHTYIYRITPKYNVDTIFLTNGACMSYYVHM